MPATFTPPPFPMFPNPLDALPAAINHMLAAEPWARAQLVPHANKTLHIVVQPFTIGLAIAPDGSVARAAPGSVADTTITLPYATAARALMGTFTGGADALMRDLRVDGDAELAQAVSLLVRNLRWDVEEDLSTVVGDAVAHRVVATARAAGGEFRRSNEKFAAGVSEYLLDENPQLVRPRAVRVLADGVRKLRDDIARLEKRLDRMTAATSVRG